MNGGGAVLSQERGPLKGALPATDNQAALIPQGLEIHQFTGVGDPRRWQQPGQLLRNVLEIAKPDRQQHVVGPNRGAALERRQK